MRHIKSLIIGLLMPLTCWLVVGLLLRVFWFEIFASIFIWAMALDFIWLLAGLVLLIITTKHLWTRWKPGIGVINLISYVLLGLLMWFYGDLIAFQIRFEIYRPHYEGIVKELYSNREKVNDNFISYGTTKVYIDDGPPRRIAFPLPGGIVDNWCGVVYDPTDEVLKINEIKPDMSNLHDSKFQTVRELFKGDMYHARPLGKHWYLCWFT